MVEVQTVFGPMLAFPDDLITRHMLDFGAHTRPEVTLLLSVVRAGDRVFDLGAHIGSFAVPLARGIGPAGHVVAVEALPETFALLRANAEHNGLAERITLRCALVAPSRRFEPVACAGNTGGTFFRAADRAWPGDVVTVDDLAEESFVPDVIKCDLEGFDAWALSTSRVVAQRRPVIYAEVSEPELLRSGTSPREFAAFFRRLGYRLFRNTGVRNVAHDRFEVQEISNFDSDRGFDVLAIHRADPRLDEPPIAGVTPALDA